MYPIKRLGKIWSLKIQKKETPPPPDFLTTPSTPSKEVENECATMG
jgi:hypothetical protein